jgi:hypothetical protein
LRYFSYQPNEKQTLFFRALDKTYKKWVVTDGDQTGTIVFDEKNIENAIVWKYTFQNEEVIISLSSKEYINLNDPREIPIEFAGEKFILVSNEPDCNSSFLLYYFDDYDYFGNKPNTVLLQIKSTKKECEDTSWELKVFENVPFPVQNAATFTAIACMTSRYFTLE